MDTYEKKYKEALEMVHDTTGDELWVDYNVHKEEALAWLEKQGENSVRWNENTDDNKPQKYHTVLMKTTHGIAEGEWQGEKWFQYRWSSRLKDSDVLFWIELSDIEKQGTERKQLYIRFGDIPSNEKSKIYRGEDEIGDENGVSVYPAFELNGNIVLGLTLPITKTTLYTQQHLLEYDDRPCYLVKGDYVGKDTDGQPLINNVSIIKKIDSYRIKEKKQGEQKVPVNDFKAKDWFVSKVDGKIHNIYHSVDKVEPKFKVGDWITNGDYIWKIVEVEPLDYILQSQDGNIVDDTISHVDEQFHSFTIEDAKDGDVLAVDWKDEWEWQKIVIFKSLSENGVEGYGNTFKNNKLAFKEDVPFYSKTWTKYLHPATKEQRDLLFQKMHEAGYEWDAEKKELKKIKQNHAECNNSILKDKLLELFQRFRWYCKDELPTNGDIIEYVDAHIQELIDTIQKPAWSEDDEKYIKDLSDYFTGGLSLKHSEEDIVGWLKSLKQRIGG